MCPPVGYTGPLLPVGPVAPISGRGSATPNFCNFYDDAQQSPSLKSLHLLYEMHFLKKYTSDLIFKIKKPIISTI